MNNSARAVDQDPSLTAVLLSAAPPLWRNRDNAAIYRHMPLHAFVNFAKASGLHHCADLAIIQPYITTAHSIMELGAGYGRVIQYLTHHTHAQISGIERDPSLYRHVQKTFGNDAFIIPLDINDYHGLHGRYDLMLWLWAGFCEFSENEQPRSLAKVIKSLLPGGRIIIDVLDRTAMPTMATYKSGSYIETETPFGIERIYVPSTQQMTQYADQLGLLLEKRLAYEPTNGKKRALFIFQKPTIQD